MPTIEQWLTVVSAVGNVGGLGTLVFLFSTDRIRTRGQVDKLVEMITLAHDKLVAGTIAAHDKLVSALTESHARAIAELIKHHADIEAGWERQYNELKDSRDYYREARLEDSGRANRVTEQLAEVALEAGKIANSAFSIIEGEGSA